MNENTRNLKIIYDFCKTHEKGIKGVWINCDCPLMNNCIQSKKVSRYNDPRFVSKCVKKVERALAKEAKEDKVDPFAEFR